MSLSRDLYFDMQGYQPFIKTSLLCLVQEKTRFTSVCVCVCVFVCVLCQNVNMTMYMYMYIVVVPCSWITTCNFTILCAIMTGLALLNSLLPQTWSILNLGAVKTWESSKRQMLCIKNCKPSTFWHVSTSNMSANSALYMMLHMIALNWLCWDICPFLSLELTLWISTESWTHNPYAYLIHVFLVSRSCFCFFRFLPESSSVQTACTMSTSFVAI